MKRSPALDALIRLADESRDAAAGSLGAAVGAAQTAEQKLALLQRYRDEYAERFQVGVSAGLTASGFCNFRAFIGKIDAAIDGQRDLLQKATGDIDVARDAWREAAQRQKSYATLATRGDRQAQARESRLQQKQSDEHAGRAGNRPKI